MSIAKIAKNFSLMATSAKKEEKKKKLKMMEKWKKEELPDIIHEIISKVEQAAGWGECDCNYDFSPSSLDIIDIQAECLKKELISRGFDVSIKDTTFLFAVGSYYKIIHVKWCRS